MIFVARLVYLARTSDGRVTKHDVHNSHLFRFYIIPFQLSKSFLDFNGICSIYTNIYDINSFFTYTIDCELLL